MAGADWACCPPSHCGIHSPGWKTCVGMGGEGGRLGVRGVGAVEACVYRPLYLATKLLPGVPPICQKFQIFWACCPLCKIPNLLPAPPPVPVGVHVGVRPIRPLWPKFCQGFPPSFQNANFSRDHCLSYRISRHFPALPPVLVNVCGGVRPLQTLRTRLCKGFPRGAEMFETFLRPVA